MKPPPRSCGRSSRNEISSNINKAALHITTYIFLTVLLCQDRLTQLEVLKSSPLKVLKPYDLGVWQGFALRATLPPMPKGYEHTEGTGGRSSKKVSVLISVPLAIKSRLLQGYCDRLLQTHHFDYPYHSL